MIVIYASTSNSNKMHSVVKAQNAVLPPCGNSGFQETKTNSLNDFHGQLTQHVVWTLVQFGLRNVL